MLPAGAVRVERLRPVDDDLGQGCVQLLQDGLAEAGADVAYRLVCVGRGVVARQEEGTVHRCSFAFTVVGAQNDEIERVADA